MTSSSAMASDANFMKLIAKRERSASSTNPKAKCEKSASKTNSRISRSTSSISTVEMKSELRGQLKPLSDFQQFIQQKLQDESSSSSATVVKPPTIDEKINDVFHNFMCGETWQINLLEGHDIPPMPKNFQYVDVDITVSLWANAILSRLSNLEDLRAETVKYDELANRILETAAKPPVEHIKKQDVEKRLKPLVDHMCAAQEKLQEIRESVSAIVSSSIPVFDDENDDEVFSVAPNPQTVEQLAAIVEARTAIENIAKVLQEVKARQH